LIQKCSFPTPFFAWKEKILTKNEKLKMLNENRTPKSVCNKRKMPATSSSRTRRSWNRKLPA